MKEKNTMKRLSWVLFLFITFHFTYAENNFPDPQIQGGVLEFSSRTVERFEMSTSNSDSVVLRNYIGLPLKALQFKIILNKDGKELRFKSLTRGGSIPASSFLLDYEMHPNQLQEDGSFADVVNVVLLGWNYNALLPSEVHHILSVNYDVLSLDNDNTTRNISLTEIIGATDVPIQDANIFKGYDETIYLRKSIPDQEDKILLLQNYPNPFNPATTIQFNLPEDSFTKLEIFNSIGERVSILIEDFLPAGINKFKWNAEGLPTGIYFYSLSTNNYVEMKKLLLMK
ncbi:MAG TPA: T9SS type A sorting domain-containing protein [Ignavibacteriaceae bacterium]|nr:T9SS type A sorting domain-containing protein [Ignavibacteriaceae bacterium]